LWSGLGAGVVGRVGGAVVSGVGVVVWIWGVDERARDLNFVRMWELEKKIPCMVYQLLSTCMTEIRTQK
jgi:hypothetical protein